MRRNRFQGVRLFFLAAVGACCLWQDPRQKDTDRSWLVLTSVVDAQLALGEATAFLNPSEAVLPPPRYPSSASGPTAEKAAADVAYPPDEDGQESTFSFVLQSSIPEGSVLLSAGYALKDKDADSPRKPASKSSTALADKPVRFGCRLLWC